MSPKPKEKLTKEQIRKNKFWANEFRHRPPGSDRTNLLGNSIRLVRPANPNKRAFKIDSAMELINCIRVLAHKTKKNKKFHVVIVSEEQFDLFSQEIEE